MNIKGFFSIILTIIVFVCILGIGPYYLGKYIADSHNTHLDIPTIQPLPNIPGSDTTPGIPVPVPVPIPDDTSDDTSPPELPPIVVIPDTPPVDPTEPDIPVIDRGTIMITTQLVNGLIQSIIFMNTKRIAASIVKSLNTSEFKSMTRWQSIKNTMWNSAKANAENAENALFEKNPRATPEELKAARNSSRNATKALFGLTAIEAFMFIFDAITLSIDIADVDGYSNVKFKDAYYKLQRQYKKELDKALQDAGVPTPLIIGPLDNLVEAVLAKKINDKVTAVTDSMTVKLADKYYDYCVANGIKDPDKVFEYVHSQLAIDLDLEGATQHAQDTVCVELGGINVSMTIDSTSGTKKTFCSYSKDMCKPNKVYSWPLLVDSITPTLVTTKAEVESPLEVGTRIRSTVLIDPETKEYMLGTVYANEFPESNTGIINAEWDDGSINHADKSEIKRVYTDTYVEWKKIKLEDGSEVGYCEYSSSEIRKLCYAKDDGIASNGEEGGGLQYDEDKGICKIDETYCKSKALDWKYNPDIDDYDCYIGAGQEVLQALFGITFTSKLRQVFDLAQYEKCKAGEVDAGYLCAGCPAGYSQDNMLNEILKKIAEVTGIASVSLLSAAPAGLAAGPAGALATGAIAAAGAFFGITSALSAGVNTFLNSVCYEECPVGYSSLGPVCYSQCPPGYTDFGVGCSKPSCGVGVGEGVGDGTVPTTLIDCPPQTTRDDGMSCWEGDHIITGYDLASRASCPAGKERIGGLCYTRCAEDHERDGLLCYPKCKEGYHKVGCCICSADCPPGLEDGGALSCTKKSLIRKSTFQLPRAKQRIVPYSSNIITPIDSIVEEVEDPVVQPKPTECPPGKTFNPWVSACLNTCPTDYERFKGMCYPSCDLEASRKGLVGKFVPSIDFPQLCFSVTPEKIVSDDGMFSYRACPEGTEYLMSACYKPCQEGYSRIEGSPGICVKDTC